MDGVRILTVLFTTSFKNLTNNNSLAECHLFKVFDTAALLLVTSSMAIQRISQLISSTPGVLSLLGASTPQISYGYSKPMSMEFH